MILDTTTRKLQVILAGAKTSVDCPVLVSYEDQVIATSSVATTTQPGAQSGTTNGVTAVDVAGAPGAGFKRRIKEITVSNVDTGAVTATIRYNDNAVTFNLYTATLQIGDNLEWIDGYGFSVTDSTGALKTPSSSAPFSISSTRGVGYGTGAGGAVTQITSRATGVTLNTVAGAITTHNASLAAEAAAVFIVTNSSVAIGDCVVVSQRSGSNGGDTEVYVSAVAAGSFSITVANNNASGGTAETGAIIINYAVIKSVSA